LILPDAERSMAIKFACPTCQHAFKTDEKFAGRQATCPSCQNKLTIPNAASAEPELIPAVDRPVAYNPKPSRSAPPPSRPFDDGDLNENFNPFASPQAEDTRPTFAGAYEVAPGDSPEYAGFLRRFAAAFLDGIITNLLVIVAVIPVGVIIGLQGLGGDLAEAVGQLTGFLVGWLYFAFMESSSAQGTLGKKLLGMKVIDLTGQPISFGRASGRYFGKIPSALLLGLGYFMQPFTERKQALHDKLAGCLVIRSR
jgi:uncharacterized RDD family membrane protein YckC